MDQATHNKIVSFIWGIADDVLRDLFKRGKYPDVILPMCVVRRMDAVLEPTKKKVLDTKKMLDEARITEQRAALCDAARQAFYNTSRFTLRDLKSRGSQQQLLADFEDYLNGFSPLRKADIKLVAADLKQILKAVSWRVETAPPVIAKLHKPGKAKADPLRGLFEATVDGKPAIVEYEPDSDLRDTEQVPLLEEGGIEPFIRREVLPYTPDAWIKEDATKIGYEVSFTRHFYKPQPLRTLEEISADILAIEKEAEGLLDGLLKVGDGGQP
jgi:hypothetical protein